MVARRLRGCRDGGRNAESAEPTTIAEKWRWVRILELSRCRTNGRGCFAEMQSRKRGAVTVVAAGCSEKTTRQSSVVIVTCANSDGSSGVYVFYDDARKKRVWWLRARGCSSLPRRVQSRRGGGCETREEDDAVVDRWCSSGDGVSDEGATVPARVQWWSEVGEPARLCEKMVVRVEEAVVGGWRSDEIVREGGGLRGGGRSTERR